MEQLQQTFNEAIKMGWSHKFIGMKISSNINHPFLCENDGVFNMEDYYISYHEIFSKDSGLIDFMKRKNQNNKFLRPGYKSDSMFMGGSIYNGCIMSKHKEYNYMVMGPMTAQEKIIYFNDNAIIGRNQ